MKVVVEPHNPSWAERFQAESKIIAQVLVPNVVTIHHIGSTAIPTIYAKPIIDMVIEVLDMTLVDAQNSAMQALDYTPMGEFGIPGRRFFRKENDKGVRTFHAHTFATGSTEIERHLAFRDFLIAHPEWARQYSDLKRKLAEAHSGSIEQYMDGKDAFIKEMDRKAAAWRRAQAQ